MALLLLLLGCVSLSLAIHWQKLETSGTPPSGRGNGAVVASPEGELYVYGGDNEVNYVRNAERDLLKLDLKTLTWKTLDPQGSAPPLFRQSAVYDTAHKAMFVFSGATMASPGSQLVYFPGVLKYSTSVNVWDHVSLENNIAYPIPRSLHCSVIHGRDLVVFGGVGEENTFYNDLWTFSMDTYEWTFINAKGAIPEGRSNSAMCIESQKLYLFGGRRWFTQSNGVLNLLHVFDINTQTWSLLSSSGPPARIGPEIVCHNGNLFMFGGADSNGAALNDLWKFSLDNRQWTQIQLDEAPAPRIRHRLVLVGNDAYMFGGWTTGYGSASFLNDVWKLNLED